MAYYFDILAMEDALWVISMTFGTKYYVGLIIEKWDKSLHINLDKKRRNKGCARHFIRGQSGKNSRIGLNRLGLLMIQLSAIWANKIKSILQINKCDANSYIDCCFMAAKGQPSITRYDSDSFQIAIDNCATSCFTNNLEDFVGTPTKVTTNITGIGKAKATFVGTARWMIVDDQGRKHELLIPGTRYQKDLPFRLLSPQHVAQVYKDPQTSCLTLIDKVIFEWGGGKWKRTLPLHKSSNVALMWSAPGYKKFFAFAANYGAPHIIPDEDKEEEQTSSEEDSVSKPIIENQVQPHDSPMTSPPQREQPVMIEFSDDETREPIKEPPGINSKQAAL
jgi:hypothetical protein